MSLTLDFEKKLDNFTLKVSLDAPDGVTALLGASGSGKSMTLRCIAGIARPDSGRIVLNDRVIFDAAKGINLRPQERRTGFLFQNYALFPGMTVFENVLMGVRSAVHKSKADRIRLAGEMIERMELSHVRNSRASEISGGEMQRTALARILVNDADIMMLDEPFSALDEHLRFSLEKELSRVMREFGKTVILVSHNRDEVFRLAGRVAVIHRGVIESSGEVRAVFENPGTVHAARLTGVKNIAPAKIDAAGFITVPGWGIRAPLRGANEDISGITAAGIRMNDMRLKPYPGETGSEKSGLAASESAEPGRFYDFAIESVTENLFSYTLDLRNPRVPDPRPLYWQVSRDIWRPGTLTGSDGEMAENAGISLFIPDRAVMALRG
ncbi:sulfate/molybdate ABC transporter ATP-binding protein [Succinimonas sp.]|uniref:sulfate/molybdate ABC transporter ATP-binding protein n=1 Tax=Succinimonas sp. TaxID=1936151 RepID=UPI0038642B4A